MLHKITLYENGTFEVKEIKVLSTQTQSGEDSGIWKTANGNMKVCAFEKINYDSKMNSFFVHTTQDVSLMKINLIYEANSVLEGFARGYKLQNKTERANIYRRTKCLKRVNKALGIMRGLKG